VDQPQNPMAAPQAPQQPVQQPVQQPAQQQQATLEDYAVGVGQLNIELQRQSAAYGHFRDVLATLEALEATGVDDTMNLPSLPFVIVRFPQNGPTPGEMKLDMNTLSQAELLQFLPLFRSLTASAGDALVEAWDGLHRVTDSTRPIIAAAKEAKAAHV